MGKLSDLLDKGKELNNDDPGNDGLNRTRAAVACTLVGLLAGVMIGYSRKWNLAYAGLGGAGAGMLIGSLLTKNNT